MGLARRLLLVHSGSGSTGSVDVGYTMTADEVAFWQDQAALLDPLAYEHVLAAATTRTVPTGERYYLINGWHLDAGSEGTTWFHRPADVNRALMFGEGDSIITGTWGGGTPFMYICKPSLVTGSDDRYTDDPRGLYFERIMRLGTLPRFQIGSEATAASQVADTFPTDFDNGMILQTSVHSVAWMIMTSSGGTGMLNTHNEISDTDGTRIAEPTLFPFVRLTMPKTLIQGVADPEGRATMTYVKLPDPGDW